jgi:hypothetical protein
MATIDKIAWEVLNATADDWEDLEQIYQMICFDFSSENYEARDQGTYYLRPAKGAPMLQEVADHIRSLVEKGLLAANQEDGRPVTNREDLSYVWKGWFRMTPQGKEAWETSEYAALA